MFASSILHRDRHAAGLVALVLLIASYSLFSLRTAIDPVEPGDILSFKRLCATAVGATMFWLVALRLRTLVDRALAGRMWQLAILALAALGPVLATRVGYDVIAGAPTEAMWARNLRWVIAWSGYFAAALLGYRLLIMREAEAARSAKPGTPLDSEDRLTRLVGEVADLGDAQRRVVLQALGGRLAYEEADPIAYELKR